MAHSRHDEYMQQCLVLARQGLGSVEPNPMVGALLVIDGTVIARGYHEKYGLAHAEVNAIRSAPDISLLAHCTLYVNLEPCVHHGKTPPCTELIIDSQISEVIIGTPDPNPLVSGKGIAKLREAEIVVHTGILEQACYELNRDFFERFGVTVGG